MNDTKFRIIPYLMDIEKLVALASEPCEKSTGKYICPDNENLSPDSPYSADQYCPPCRLRSTIGHVRLDPPNQHSYKGNTDTLKPFNIHEPTNE